VPITDYAMQYRQEIAQSWPKAAAATNAVAIDPGTNHHIHYLRAPIVFPSEALTLATHRQPYSRNNPYMSPGGISNLVTDNLESFDCRNTSSALTVPPVLPLEPACITQKPNAFEGVTADFAQLKPAP
jgi:hypothetical protein